MPSVSVACIAMALKAMFAMVVFGATGVAVVGFANDYNFGSTGIPFPLAVQYQMVKFTSDFNAGSCHTCLHIRSDDAGIQQLWDKPSPTLPLKISYAASYIHSKPTPTPPPTARKATSAPASSSISRLIAPSHGASTLAASSMSRQNLLRCLANFVFALACSAPWVIICKIIWLLSFMATMAYLIPRPKPFQRCLQLPKKAKEVLGKVLAIALVSFHKPAMLLSIGMYKARTNGIPNLEFRRPRQVQADDPTAFYEQYLFATVDIDPSFGPSIQNAETEFRSRLERVEGDIGKQAEIVAFFRKTLDSFTRALAVAEATPEGRNTRYLTVIQDQDRLIDELRMLHEYREQAFQGNEELIQLLCQSDKDGFLEILEGKKQKHPVVKYSAEYDKFIISPLDGPATLSMKVSVQSAPFHRRPVTILDSDPHWQKFLESTAEKGSEQEARLASYEDDLNKWDEKEGEDAKDGCVQRTCNVSQFSSDEYFEEARGGDDIGRDNIGGDDSGGDDIGVNDADSPNEALKLKSNLAWFEWKLACMKGSQGTPRGSDSKQFSDKPPAITARVTNETADARWMQEQTWADYPKQFAIRDCESSIDILKVEIACMESKATSEGRPRKGRKGETLPEPTTVGDSSLSRLGSMPNQRSD